MVCHHTVDLDWPLQLGNQLRRRCLLSTALFSCVHTRRWRFSILSRRHFECFRLARLCAKYLCNSSAVELRICPIASFDYSKKTRRIPQPSPFLYIHFRFARTNRLLGNHKNIVLCHAMTRNFVCCCTDNRIQWNGWWWYPQLLLCWVRQYFGDNYCCRISHVDLRLNALCATIIAVGCKVSYRFLSRQVDSCRLSLTLKRNVN